MQRAVMHMNMEARKIMALLIWVEKPIWTETGESEESELSAVL